MKNKYKYIKIIYKLINNLDPINFIDSWIGVCNLDDYNNLWKIAYLCIVVVAIWKIALNFEPFFNQGYYSKLSREREKEADLIEFDDDN